MKKNKFIMNIPNLLSFSRIVFIPLFLYFLVLHEWIYALIVFAVASLTDLADGWSARKLNQESEFGKFIDPLADKFLVISALTALMILDPYLKAFDLWMIIVIVGRDILLTVMRYIAIKRGRSLKTSGFGKIKTVFQMASVVIILMIYFVRKHGYVVTHESIPYWIMLVVTLLTAFSGIRYLITNWGLFFSKKNEGEPGANDGK